MGKKKHWNRNKDRVSLGSTAEVSSSKSTSSVGTTLSSTTVSSTPLLSFFYGASKSPIPASLTPYEESCNKRTSFLSVTMGWQKLSTKWGSTRWLNPNRWSPRVRKCILCRAVEWIYNFCAAFGRMHWKPQWCKDLLITLALAASCVYSLYLVLEFAVSQVASAQELDANCSIVYVTIPGPVITVSLIATSPSNPARGTYYFSVINGTTGWLDSIAPPSRFSTLHTRTPEITPIISSIPATGMPPPSQLLSSSTGPSGPIVASSTMPPPGVTTTFTTMVLSGSTMVTTVITSVSTVSFPVSLPSITTTATTAQPGTSTASATSNPAPINEPQRPWPSPILPSSAIISGTVSSVKTPPIPPSSSLPMGSSTLGPTGPLVLPTQSSIMTGPISTTSTNMDTSPGLPSNVPDPDSRTTSTTLVIITTTISGGRTTTLSSVSTTVFGGGSPPSFVPSNGPIVSTKASTSDSSISRGVTPTLGRSSSLASSLPVPSTPRSVISTSTFTGGATSVLIGVSTTNTSPSRSEANPTLSDPTSSQILTTRTVTPPGASNTMLTVTSMTGVSPVPLSSDGQTRTTVLTATTALNQGSTRTLSSLSGSPATSSNLLSATESGKFTVSLPSPSTGPGASPAPSVTSVITITTTQITEGLTTTMTFTSSVSFGRPGSSLSLIPSVTSSSSLFTTPSSTTLFSSTRSSNSEVTTSSTLTSGLSSSFSTSLSLTASLSPVSSNPSSVLATTTASSRSTSSVMLSSGTTSPPSSLVSLTSSSALISPSSSSISPSIGSSFSGSPSTMGSSLSLAPDTRSSSFQSSSAPPASLSASFGFTLNPIPSFANTSSTISSSSFTTELPLSSTSSLRFNITSSSSLSSSSLLSSGKIVSSSAISSSASRSLSPIVSTSSETGFMSIQTETTATRSALSLSASTSANSATGRSSQVSLGSSAGGTVVVTSVPATGPTTPPGESRSFQVRGRMTKVISYDDTAISFVFPSPDITTTVSYWTGVYPAVTGPLPSDLQTLPLTTRTEQQTPPSALPSFELFSSRRRSFKTVVTTIYDEGPGEGEGLGKRQDNPTTTAPLIATAVVPVPAKPEPSLCGESGNFTLNFDDTVVGNDDNLLLVANGMKNPYHHLFYANGFTYVPDKWEPYPAISQPNVAMFLPLAGRLFPNTPFAGTLLPGEIGAGPRASVNAYWFNAYSGYFGCALNGLTPCTLRISGYRYDAVLKQEVLVVEQNATIPACWGYIDCRLTQVFFNADFSALSGIQFNAYTYNLGIPQVHMLDDLQMEWYNSTCSAGILRIGHV